jgi:hypothetical protein
MTKLTVAFCNFADAHKISHVYKTLRQESHSVTTSNRPPCQCTCFTRGKTFYLGINLILHHLLSDLHERSGSTVQNTRTLVDLLNDFKRRYRQRPTIRHISYNTGPVTLNNSYPLVNSRLSHRVNAILHSGPSVNITVT